MSRRILLLLCCFCSIWLGHGQINRVDSLLQVLKTIKGEAAKVNLLNAVAEEYRNNNPDTAIYYAGKANKIACRLDDKMGVANAYLIIGNALTSLGDFEKAMKSCNDALKVYEQLLVSGKLPDRSKILKQKAITLKAIGVIFGIQSNYPESLKCSLASLKIMEEIGDKQGIARTSGNIGLINYFLGNYSFALKYYFTSLKINHEIGDKKGIALNFANIAGIYQIQGNYPDALKFSLDALKISQEIGDKRDIALNHGNIGLIFLKLGNYPEALKNQSAALRIREEIGDKQGVALSYYNIGNIYAKQKNNKQATEYFSKSLFLAKNIGSLEVVNECCLSLSQLDSMQGNFKESLMHYKMYVVTRDSVFNLENTKKVMQSKLQYEFDKKEASNRAEQEKRDAIALKELQNQKLLRNYLLGIIGLVLILSFLIYRGYHGQQQLRLHEIRNKIAGDLHDDIGSTLNSISIYSEVAKNKDENHDEALEMIGDASRKVIDAMSDIVWTINTENDSFEKIIFRMKSLAYNLFRVKNIEFTFHTDEILDTKKLSLEDRRNFYLIFKEAVNNLVKYSGATRAAISLTYNDGLIKLSIMDNGTGFDPNQANTGNGLRNMKRRADEMNAEFSLESQEGNGTHINLILKA